MVGTGFGEAAGLELVSPAATLSGFLSAPPIARIPKPTPVSSRATPTTIPKSASWSAMYAELSAVVSAVSVTHTLRAAFWIGWFVFGSTAAYCVFSVPPPGISSDFGVPGFAV